MLGYDILKQDATTFVWVEAVEDLETAGHRARELARQSAGQYVVFEQRTQQIVARFEPPVPFVS